MLIRLPARTIVRWRWPIVVGWVLLAAAMWPVAREIHTRLQVGGRDLPGAESTEAEAIIRARFATSFSAFAIVAVRHGGALTVDSARFAGYLDSLVGAIERLPFSQKILTWRNAGDPTFVSPDRHITFVLVGMRELADGATSEIPALREAVRSVQGLSGPDFVTEVTGSPAFDYDTRSVAAQDSDRLEQRLLPLTWLLLIFAFGALVAAFVPVAVGFLAIFVALGIESMLAALMPMSIFILNITTMVGLGVGIDYSLLVVTRFREELESGADRLVAAERTIRTAGHTVLTSGGTVMVGVAALMIVPILETQSVGLGGLVVVFSAVALSVTFLPAILAILGHNVDRPKFLANALARFRKGTGWTRYAESIARNPIRALVISGTIIVALAAPSLWLRVGLPAKNWFPKDTESSRGLSVLQDMGQGGALLPIRVVIELPPGAPMLDPERLRGLKTLGDSLRANPRVQQVRGLVDLRPGIPLWQYLVLYGDTARARARMPDVLNAYLGRDGSTTVLNVFLRDTVTLDGALDVVHEVRAISARGNPDLRQARLQVGGFFPSALDFRDRLVHEFGVIVALVLGVTAIMLAWVFKSLLVPAKAVVMNTLSVSAAFGLTVIVFQWGIGGSLIGLEGPTEAIFVMGPVLVFAMVFGLSMDYEVFLLSRIKEEFDLSHDNDAAMIAGLSATAQTITRAAAIMILVFGAFAFARVMAVQMIGFGLAVAVLLDATVIRMVMVPAVMHLAGRFNWWPGYRRRHVQALRRSGGAASARG